MLPLGVVLSPNGPDLQCEAKLYAFGADVFQLGCRNCELTVVDDDCEHDVLLGLVRVRGEHHTLAGVIISPV